MRKAITAKHKRSLSFFSRRGPKITMNLFKKNNFLLINNFPQRKAASYCHVFAVSSVKCSFILITLAPLDCKWCRVTDTFKIALCKITDASFA